jgi:RNA polymerase sigma-70 factor, ECF subfamily
MGSAILKRVAAGDAGAFADCLRQHGDLIWSLARKHSHNAADAEDASQDICLRLWRNAHRYEASRGTEAAFIATLARRVLIDRYRASTRHPQTTAVDVQDLPTAATDDARLFADAQRAALALRELRPEAQQVIALSVHDGLTQSEIATTTGMPLGTVKSLLRRGFRALREQLGEGSKR